MSDTNKTFHLAITMAGAISAGAYTAGVMDFLLEALDDWTEMKQKANKFFEKYPKLKGATWDEFKNTAEFTEIEKSGKNLNDLKNRAVRFNAVPDHEIQIEIISGASAGGMTAAIASLVVQLEKKHHVKFLLDEKEPETLIEREKNRLYNSWVNLTSSDMLSVLLGDSDIKLAGEPVAALNSQFIRQVSERALQIDETDNILHAPYVAEDFNLFVTLTNLEGYQKSLNIDSSGQRAEVDSYGDFITYNHSDLIMFSFGENKDPGTVHIDFKRENDPLNDENIKLLGDAAVATGAFPIGLEYASFSRKAEVINDNYLIKQIHPDSNELVEKDKNYLTTFIDGGLINNEPFELTDCLLKEKLKLKLKKRSSKEYLEKLDEDFRKQLNKEFENGLSDAEMMDKLDGKMNRWFETEVRKQKNYTILMIDPFPSEKKPPKVEKPTNGQNYYPFDLLGVLGQLIYTMRSQLLVKTNLFGAARDVTDFSCYLIAPRRRKYEKTGDGEILLDDQQKPVPVYEKDDHGKIVTDREGKPIPKVYDGSAAIACGSLGGFGGFLDKEFRVHDFYLGRINCQSFIRRHFCIKYDGDDSIENAVTKAYTTEAKEIFQTECKKNFVPIIPDMTLLKAETLLSTENKPPSPNDLYHKLTFPKYDMKTFRASKDKILNRIWLIIDSLLQKNKLSWMAKKYIQLGFWFSKYDLFDKITAIVHKQLKDWELTK